MEYTEWSKTVPGALGFKDVYITRMGRLEQTAPSKPDIEINQANESRVVFSFTSATKKKQSIYFVRDIQDSLMFCQPSVSLFFQLRLL